MSRGLGQRRQGFNSRFESKKVCGVEPLQMVSSLLANRSYVQALNGAAVADVNVLLTYPVGTQ